MSDELTAFETMRLGLRGHTDLDEMIQFLKNGYKVVELVEFAEQAGIESPGANKSDLAEQLIAKLTVDEEANVSPEAGDGSATGEAETSDAAPSPTPGDDETTPDGSVLTGDGQAEGVPLPAKVASYRPDQLWPQILGWEIDQGLDEDARAAFDEAQQREYLAYLWIQGNMGRAASTWLKISEYEFRGILRD